MDKEHQNLKFKHWANALADELREKEKPKKERENSYFIEMSPAYGNFDCGEVNREHIKEKKIKEIQENIDNFKRCCTFSYQLNDKIIQFYGMGTLAIPLALIDTFFFNEEDQARLANKIYDLVFEEANKIKKEILPPQHLYHRYIRCKCSTNQDNSMTNISYEVSHDGINWVDHDSCWID